MTTVANVVSNYTDSLLNGIMVPVDPSLRSPSFKYDDNIIKKWEEIRENVRWDNILDLPMDEVRRRISELYKFVNLHKDFFIVKTDPVSYDMLKDHFEPHFNDINELVRRRILRPLEAVKIAECIYLYDCVFPHLSEDIIMPKNRSDLKLKVILIPDELYDWMFRLDCLWLKLLIKKVLDRDLLEYIEKHKDKFVNKALRLKVFLPVPPKKLHERVPNIEKLWFRGYHVNWDVVHEYLYRRVSNILIDVL